MQKRAIFPTIMFVLAGASFVFGGFQYFQTRSVLAADQKRMAFIVTTIARSKVEQSKKQELYASISSGLPASPGVFSLDFSGSFASQTGADTCNNEGQRSICRALTQEGSDADVVSSVCGSCNPR